MDYQRAYNLIVPVVEKKYGVAVMISKDVRSLLKRGGEALPPLPIPPFTPQKFASRWSF